MKVIIAIDQTENWKQIIESVVNRLWPQDTIFRILTVLEPSKSDSSLPGLNIMLAEANESRASIADKILHDARSRICRGVPECTAYTEVRKGRAQDELVSAAANWMADKLILGAHGRSANRLIPGTVSSFVAKNSICSVELVRLKAEPVIDQEPAYV
jgi:nucleotide-binding universal stress UspA family protein